MQRDASFNLLRAFRVRSGVADGNFGRAVRLCLDLQIGGDIGQLRRYFVLRDVQVANHGVVPAFEPHRFPHAHGDEAWTPIPSILIRRLARVRIGADSLLHVGIVYRDRRQAIEQELYLLEHFVDRRTKHDLKRV